MATREENLKKINEKLEMMSDEELEQVAGGNIGQTSADSQLLYDHGLIDDWHGNLHFTFHWNSESKKVDAAWARAGITCCTTVVGANKYWKDGKEISREEAHNYVRNNFKRIHHIYY